MSGRGSPLLTCLTEISLLHRTTPLINPGTRSGRTAVTAWLDLSFLTASDYTTPTSITLNLPQDPRIPILIQPGYLTVTGIDNQKQPKMLLYVLLFAVNAKSNIASHANSWALK